MFVLFQNLPWKILSLIVAFGLWFIVMSSNTIETSKEVELKIDVPPGLVLAEDVPERVTFRLSGSKFFLQTVVNELNEIRIDLTDAKAGPTYYRILRDSIPLPIGVKVLSISPSTIQPVLEEMRMRNVPIQVSTTNEVQEGYRLVRVRVEPKVARIKGPKSKIEKILKITVPPIDLSQIDVEDTLIWQQAVDPGISGISFADEALPQVTVELEPTGSNYRIAGVPLQVQTDRKFKVSSDKVALYVRAPAKQIRSLNASKVRAYVNLQNSDPGVYIREVRVDLPGGVKLVRVVPSQVRVQLD